MGRLLAAAVVISVLAACSGRNDGDGVAIQSVTNTTTATSPEVSADVTTLSGSDVDPSVSVATDDTGVDSDGDGVDDGVDNCPNDHNPDQRDICSGTTIKPGGGCRASLFVARPAELNRPLLVVEFTDVGAVEADRPTCGEGTPLLILPPDWKEVSSTGRLVYVLAEESAIAEPGSGIEIPGADFDDTLPPKNMELDSGQLGAVIGDALDGPAASDVAAAMTDEAADTIPSDTWRRIVELNPALENVVLGTDQVAIEGDG